MTENEQGQEKVIIINPEQIRIKLSEIIRMRNAARNAHGLIQNLSLEERARRIVEVHAVSTKIKVFLQELIACEEESLEEAGEEARAERRKLDRAYKSTRGLSDEEKREAKKAKTKESLSDLAKATGVDIAALLAKVKENQK